MCQQCPECRKEIRDFKITSNKIIDKTVKTIAMSKKLGGQNEEYQHYENRVKQYRDWKAKHKVSQVKAGDKLDVRDTEYIWCVATVECKITSQNRPALLYIHYEVKKLYSMLQGWNRKYDEYMYETS